MRCARSGTVCAVIPTYDRRDLLLETLDGLARQTQPCDAALVVDNASTDGSAEAVAHRHPSVDVLRLATNTGSAGGFSAGIDWALRRGYDWVWLIDNDSIPDPDALGELLGAHARFPPGGRPVLLASKVVWTDGSILPLNVPLFKRHEIETFYGAAAKATLSVRAAPYAGLLVSAEVIRRCGLPIAGYFLWNDDIEWTGRLLRNDFGVLVPTSVLCHKTPGNPATVAEAGPRFFYEIRNKMWMLRGSDAFGKAEKFRFGAMLMVRTFQFLRAEPSLPGALATVARGVAGGLREPARPPGPLDGPVLTSRPEGDGPAPDRLPA